MNKVFCRYMKCSMSFSTERHRKQHESLMHKDMIKESALLLLDKINNTNPKESLDKKVLKTSLGFYSYKEANEKINDKTEESTIILEALKNIVESYFKQYPDYGMEQMIRISDFKIK